MVMTDPIADMLTRIRNANSVHHDKVEIPGSKIKVAIAVVSAFPSSFAARTMRITLPNCGPGSRPRRCRSSPLMSTLICRHL